MSDKRYEANIIRATAVEPANNLESTSAPGVWSIDEVVELQKKEKWPTVGNVITNAENVFSTFLYDGTGANQAINNGIDLTEGGLVWLKSRDGSSSAFHTIYDTARGTGPNGGRIFAGTASTNGASTQSDGLQSFNSNGFTLGANLFENGTNASYGTEYVSFTFRKQTKFFDVVTYTGDGSSDFSKKVSHNLGQRPGMVFVKNTSASSNWLVWYPLMDSSAYNLNLNNTNQSQSSNETNGRAYVESSGDYRLQVSATGTGVDANKSGDTYVAYFFSHNNNDGEFGPDQDEDIIKCGSFSTDSSGDASVTLGFEPQWLMIKRYDGTSNWTLMDIMRGYNDRFWNPLYADTDNAESGFAATRGFPTSTGFEFDGQLSASANYIYMAIRRPQAAPTDASQVFAISTNGEAGDSKAPAYRSTFPVDMYFEKSTGGSPGYISSRLTGPKYMQTNATSGEASDSNLKYDFMNGVYNSTGSNTAYYGWMWKRARGYFDVVCYTGSGSNRTVSHNLGVVPEMMWVKVRSTSDSWHVYHKGMNGGSSPEDYYLQLNRTDDEIDNASIWNDTAPSSSVFTVGTNGGTNANNTTYIAYLFATVAGVSKVGSYTGSSSAVNVDCGFTSGARFILIKRSSASGDGWFTFDSKRGIVAGNDPFLYLNDQQAEFTSYDAIDPYNAGFTVTTALGGLNTNGSTYIFYAIAT